MQRNYIFPGRYASLTYYEDVLFYSYRDISRYRRYRLKTISRQHCDQLSMFSMQETF